MTGNNVTNEKRRNVIHEHMPKTKLIESIHMTHICTKNTISA